MGTLDFSKFLRLFEAAECIAEFDSFFEADSPFDPEHIRTSKKSTLLDPKTGSKWRAGDRFRQLEAVFKHEIQMGTPPNRVWVTFSDVSKLGQRMKVGSGKSTPVGVFAFPAQYVINKKDDTPFNSRAYMHVFRIKKDHYEVGRKGYGEEPNYAEIKKKFNANDSDPVPDALRGIRGKLERFIYNSYYDERKFFRDNPNKDRIYNYLNEILSTLMDKVANNYMDATGSTPQQKISNLDLSYLDEKSSEEAIVEAKKKLFDYMSSLTFYTYEGHKEKQYKKYKNIDPENLSVELSPEYIEAIRRNPYDYNSLMRKAVRSLFPVANEDVDDNLPQTLKTPPVYDDNDQKPIDPPKPEIPTPISKRFTLEEIQEMDYGSFDSYSPVFSLIKKVKNATIESDPLVAKFKNIISKAVHKELSKFNNPTPEGYETQVPHYDKLKGIADKYGLDLKSAIRDGLKLGKDERQFLYRSTQELAKQYSKKNPKTSWQMAWNKFFRDIDIPSVADTEDSGYVHSSESTQGVFMDPRDIEQIATIINRSHSDYRDPASRPTINNWASSTGMHKRTVEPTNQRKGNFIDVSYLRGKDAKEKTDIALDQRIEGIVDSQLYYINKVDASNAAMLSSYLIMILKLLKNKLAINTEFTKSYSVNKLIRKLNDIEKSTPVTSMPPQIKKQIDELRKVAEGQQSTQRLSKWTPTEDERAQYWPKPPEPVKPAKPVEYNMECENCDKKFNGEDLAEMKCPYCGSEEIKEMQQCGKCGKKFSNDDDNCPNCDAPSGYNPSDYQHCDSCGEEYSVDDSKCPNCGYNPDDQHCAKCDNNFDEDDDECPYCGAPAGYDPDDWQYCPECGKEYEKGEDVCPHCGYDPDAPEDEEDETPPPPAEANPVS